LRTSRWAKKYDKPQTISKLEFGHLSFEDGKVGVARLFEENRKGITGVHIQSNNLKFATPLGWKFKDSLSNKFQFVPEDVTRQ